VSDEPTTLPPSRHGGVGSQPPARGDRLHRSVVRFASAAVVLTVLAVGAGIVLGRTQPDRGARMVVREFVVVEDAGDAAPGAHAVTPTSGPARGEPACGVQDVPLDADEQVATLASGVVLLQHGPTATTADRRTLEELAARGRVAVAPNPDLSDAVVATAWRHRMPLDRGRPELLHAFVTGHVDRAPDLRPCPEGPAASR
jgi:hypothetical protein